MKKTPEYEYVKGKLVRKAPISQQPARLNAKAGAAVGNDAGGAKSSEDMNFGERVANLPKRIAHTFSSTDQLVEDATRGKLFTYFTGSDNTKFAKK